MSGAGQAPLPFRAESPRRVPRWVKLAAVPLALIVLATLNLRAAAADRHRTRLAADRIDVTVVPVGGEAALGRFALSVLLTNNGPRPLGLRDLRVTPAAYSLLFARYPDAVVARSSARVEANLEARCPVPPTPAGLRLAVHVVAPSGRVSDVAVDTDGQLVTDLARQACGEVAPDVAARLKVSQVSSSRYGVSFLLAVADSAAEGFSIGNLSAAGLSFAIRGGTPVPVAGHASTVLHVTAQLPSCALLPPPAGRPGSLRYGTMSISLLDEHGVTKTATYTPEPGDALYPALLALRARICPGAATVPTGTRRPRGFS